MPHPRNGTTAVSWRGLNGPNTPRLGRNIRNVKAFSSPKLEAMRNSL